MIIQNKALVLKKYYILNLILFSVLLINFLSSCAFLKTPADIVDALDKDFKNEKLATYSLNTEAQNTKITVSGYVSNLKDYNTVSKIITNHSSPYRIKNEVQLKQTKTVLGQIPAANLAEKLLMEIKEDPSFGQFNLQTESKEDTVILKGIVDSYQDYYKLSKKIRELSPYGSIVNTVSLRNKLTDPEIATIVMSRLQREGFYNITSQVINGKLTLMGDLGSFREVDRALSLIVGTPDIIKITNAITVNGKAYPIK